MRLVHSFAAFMVLRESLSIELMAHLLSHRFDGCGARKQKQLSGGGGGMNA